MNTRLIEKQEMDMGVTRFWRDDAMDEAIRGFDCADYKEAMLQQIRKHLPGYATLQLHLDRSQLLCFLDQEAINCQYVLRGRHDYFYQSQKKTRPYLGWFILEWKGETLEIALPPGTGIVDHVLCIAQHETVLERFSEALMQFVIRPSGRSLCYSDGWSSAPELDAEIGNVTWDDVVLAPNILTQVRDGIDSFFEHREAYCSFGFAWRRGILLVGPPGTGKTMICKAAAAARPELPFLYVRDLREQYVDDAIEAIFERARKLAPCILAFEDMDGLINEFNRTQFLNELDGFHNNEGMLIIASSNHPGRIDEALLKRPSRFDRVVHIGLPALAERAEFFVRILSRATSTEKIDSSLDIQALAQRVAEKSEGFTPAYIKEAVVAAALQCAQDGAMMLDDRFADAVITQVNELKAHLKHMKDPEALAEMHSSNDVMGLRR